jgi:histone deacetylase 6
MGDGDYMHAFQKVVMPIALEFDPDLVISKFWLSS